MRVLRVRLMDTETADGPVPIEARAAIAPGGQVPLTFTLRFDDRVIEPGHAYALVAEITSGNVIWFRNIEPYAVNPLLPDDPVIIVTDFTGATTEDSGPPPQRDLPSAAPILDVTWRAESIGGTPILPRSERHALDRRRHARRRTGRLQQLFRPGRDCRREPALQRHCGDADVLCRQPSSPTRSMVSSPPSSPPGSGGSATAGWCCSTPAAAMPWSSSSRLVSRRRRVDGGSVRGQAPGKRSLR